MPKPICKPFFRYIFMSLGVIYVISMTIGFFALMWENMEIRSIAARSDVYLQKHAEGYCNFVDQWEEQNKNIFGTELASTSDPALQTQQASEFTSTSKEK